MKKLSILCVLALSVALSACASVPGGLTPAPVTYLPSDLQKIVSTSCDIVIDDQIATQLLSTFLPGSETWTAFAKGICKIVNGRAAVRGRPVAFRGVVLSGHFARR